MDINNKLKHIFNFIKSNHSYNKALQLQALCNSLDPRMTRSNKEKVRSLLVDVASTQASPKLDLLCDFWIVISSQPDDTFVSLKSFCEFLGAGVSQGVNPDNKHILTTTFDLLRNIPGLGDKTAALFVKTIALAHLNDSNLGYSSQPLSFFDDKDSICTPIGLDMKVPVDAVIKHIFSKHLGVDDCRFFSINKIIKDFSELNGITGFDMIYWDDLWFWGFVTQHGGGASRKTEFNKQKYMSWKSSTASSLNAIEPMAEQFIQILMDA